MTEEYFWAFVDEVAPEEGLDPVALRLHVEKRSRETARELNEVLMDLNRRHFKVTVAPALRSLITDAALEDDKELVVLLAVEQTLLARYLSRCFS